MTPFSFRLLRRKERKQKLCVCNNWFVDDSAHHFSLPQSFTQWLRSRARISFVDKNKTKWFERLRQFQVRFKGSLNHLMESACFAVSIFSFAANKQSPGSIAIWLTGIANHERANWFDAKLHNNTTRQNIAYYVLFCSANLFNKWNLKLWARFLLPLAGSYCCVLWCAAHVFLRNKVRSRPWAIFVYLLIKFCALTYSTKTACVVANDFSS